jgi:methylenetetrahydrofolate dehydrogenase (NADP+)/methenyltetrahydrofolate cyclohydrolase
MPAQLIDGKAIADQVHAQTAAEIQRLKSEHNVTPGLAVVLVGDNPASTAYVSMKDKMAHKLGLYSERHNLAKETTEAELLKLVERLNANPKIHGILVQSPPPPHIDEDKVFDTVDHRKDVDGFHPVNVGKLALGDPTGFAPCTPAGVHHLLVRSGVKIEGRHVVVLGRSRIVGKPVALILMQKAKNANATVTVCHSRSENLADHTRRADILIAAIGVPFFLKADMVREGAVVIDVGINRVDDPKSEKGYRLVGDVEFEAVRQKASLITPVPGGVGPMTIAMLMHNTVKACKQISGIK